MQTFVPYPDFTESAHSLGIGELRTQADDILTILDVLHSETGATSEDPAVLMWRGYEMHLATYGIAHFEVMESRRFRYRFMDTKRSHLQWHFDNATSGDFNMKPPKWVGVAKVHDSHRSALIRLNPMEYGGRFASTPPHIEVFWPRA